MSSTILSKAYKNWVEITLNRPDRLNSFNEEMHLALRAELERARDSGARAILLTGSGRAFCAGQEHRAAGRSGLAPVARFADAPTYLDPQRHPGTLRRIRRHRSARAAPGHGFDPESRER